MKVQIAILDNASPALRDATNALSFRRAARTAAQAVRVQIRKHLVAKEGQPNKNSWPKQHWYARARERVAVVEEGNATAITIDLPGFAMRYSGDPSVIYPVNSKYLAIPIHAMAYGKRPREFKDVVFIPVNRGRTVGLLSMRVGTGKTHVWINLFRLVKFVRTKADPSMLPTDESMQDTATAAIIQLASRITG